MTTGSKGLHIYIPLRRSAEFSKTKEFAKACAEYVIQQLPQKATLEIRKDKRGKKVFIDILRNQQGATAVSPYAIRARVNAPIATPIAWSLVKEPSLDPQMFTIENIFSHLEPDPWNAFASTKQTLTKAIKKLKTI